MVYAKIIQRVCVFVLFQDVRSQILTATGLLILVSGHQYNQARRSPLYCHTQQTRGIRQMLVQRRGRWANIRPECFNV